GAFVIAEGVEDEETLEFLRSMDGTSLRGGAIIQGGQGYGLGRPVTDIPTTLRLPARPLPLAA
ncbi:MAG: hypothetical protein QOE87_4403, partial [Gaiellales bacterium]|nr:hypothetical protein [Gaiellales bacterium]